MAPSRAPSCTAASPTPPPRAEHDQLVAGPQAGHRAEDVVGRAVGDAEHSGVPHVHAVRDAADGAGPGDHLVGERPDERRPGDPVADGDIAHAVRHLGHRAGELAAGHERRRHGHLVPVGDQQHVREVHGGGIDPHPHLPFPDLGSGQVDDLDDLGRAVGPADGGAHVTSAREKTTSRHSSSRCRARPASDAPSRTSSFDAATASGPLRRC
ncbi:MAG TPA: hypothetical protein VFZ77_11625, partial [Acidimicrobiales bacterium]